MQGAKTIGGRVVLRDHRGERAAYCTEDAADKQRPRAVRHERLHADAAAKTPAQRRPRIAHRSPLPLWAALGEEVCATQACARAERRPLLRGRVKIRIGRNEGDRRVLGENAVHVAQFEPFAVEGVNLEGALAANIHKAHGLLRGDEIGLEGVLKRASDVVKVGQARAIDRLGRQRERALPCPLPLELRAVRNRVGLR